MAQAKKPADNAAVDAEATAKAEAEALEAKAKEEAAEVEATAKAEADAAAKAEEDAKAAEAKALEDAAAAEEQKKALEEAEARIKQLEADKDALNKDVEDLLDKPGDDAPAKPKVEEDDGKTATVYVHCLRKQRFRAGHIFTRGWNEADVTKKQLGEINDDPHLELHTRKPKALTQLEARKAATSKKNAEIREKETAERKEKREHARAVRNEKLERMHKEAEEDAERRRAAQ